MSFELPFELKQIARFVGTQSSIHLAERRSRRRDVDLQESSTMRNDFEHPVCRGSELLLLI
jgi:hypothetical protein